MAHSRTLAKVSKVLTAIGDGIITIPELDETTLKVIRTIENKEKNLRMYELKLQNTRKFLGNVGKMPVNVAYNHILNEMEPKVGEKPKPERIDPEIETKPKPTEEIEIGKIIARVPEEILDKATMGTWEDLKGEEVTALAAETAVKILIKEAGGEEVVAKDPELAKDILQAADVIAQQVKEDFKTGVKEKPEPEISKAEDIKDTKEIFMSIRGLEQELGVVRETIYKRIRHFNVKVHLMKGIKKYNLVEIKRAFERMPLLNTGLRERKQEQDEIRETLLVQSPNDSRYLTIYELTKELNVGEKTIYERINKFNIEVVIIEGKHKYKLAKIKQAFKKMPVVHSMRREQPSKRKIPIDDIVDDGLVTFSELVNKLDKSRSSIFRCIQEYNIESCLIKGEQKYRFVDVKEALNDKFMGTRKILKELNISSAAFYKRIKKLNIKPRRFSSRNRGQYSLFDIKRAIRDMPLRYSTTRGLREIKEYQKNEYMTIKELVEEFKITRRAIERRIEKFNLETYAVGGIRQYKVVDIERAFELNPPSFYKRLRNLEKIEEYQKGEYMTTHELTKELHVSRTPIYARVYKYNIKPYLVGGKRRYKVTEIKQAFEKNPLKYYISWTLVGGERVYKKGPKKEEKPEFMEVSELVKSLDVTRADIHEIIKEFAIIYRSNGNKKLYSVKDIVEAIESKKQK